VAKYTQSYAPGAKLTSTANQVIDFALQGKNSRVQFLSFQTYATPCRIKINSEDTMHLVDANSELVLQDIDIDKIVVVDAGVEFYYTALGE